MNFSAHNLDLTILQRDARAPRFRKSPGWTHVDWKPTPLGGNMVYLRGLALPPQCSADRTDVKIEAPPNLYEPVGPGLLAYYRNVWVTPDIRVLDPRTRRWLPMPRLHGRDHDGFAYLCLHPDAIPQTPEGRPSKNILDFIRVLDLFLLNPGYKAAAGELL